MASSSKHFIREVMLIAVALADSWIPAFEDVNTTEL